MNKVSLSRRLPAALGLVGEPSSDGPKLKISQKQSGGENGAAPSTRMLNMCSRDGSKDVPMVCSFGRSSRRRDIKDLLKPSIDTSEVCVRSGESSANLKSLMPLYRISLPHGRRNPVKRRVIC